jgi:hypothetical protein
MYRKTMTPAVFPSAMYHTMRLRIREMTVAMIRATKPNIVWPLVGLMPMTITIIAQIHLWRMKKS